MTISTNAQRALFVASAAVTLPGAFSLVGWTGFADRPISAAQYQYDKVTVCHVAGKSGNRVTITVAAAAVPAHLAHGDTLGPCP